MKYWFVVVICISLALMIPSPARADGIIIPVPPPCPHCPPPPCPGPYPCPPPSPMVQLVIRYHHVTITIQDQVAVTHVEQVFYNPNNWAVEGTYLFPIPQDAAVSSFTLWVDGRPVKGEILEAEQARKKYHEIVSSLRDPALLEYADRGAVQAHIFPIPPQGERKVELEYVQALRAEEGLVRYLYPLSTEKFTLWPLEKVSIHVDVQSSLPIRAAYSPSHPIEVSRESNMHIRAGYEASQVIPDTDFAFYYSLGEENALHLLSYRNASDPDDPDGFFLLLLAPKPEVPAQTLAKDLILVLDRSGSMEGEKFQQAQEALRYILKHLNSEDRFNIIAFSTGTKHFATTLRPASEAEEAIRWVDALNAQGSTDINRALLEATEMADREKPTYLIFLTDGLPTEGVVDSQQILKNLAASAPKSLRLFVFGVGYDVDTFLLDSLSQAHHGTSTYVLPGERLDEILSAFYAKVSTPVLTDLELDFGTVRVYDLYPSPLPDLFSGSQIILVGRYRQGGSTQIILTGRVNEETQTFQFPGQVFEEDSSLQGPLAYIPRLWATRKIGHLLNQIRLKGPDRETIDQIVKLSIRYGIVTPYTSYLVTEPLPLGMEAQQEIATQQFGRIQAMPTAPTFGQAAVQKAADQGTLAEAYAPVSPGQDAANVVRIVGSTTFVFKDNKWMDTRFDPDRMTPIKVAFLSDEYFALMDARPELYAAFALGKAVIALSNGTAYEVVEESTTQPPITIPPTTTSTPIKTSPALAQTTPSTTKVPPSTEKAMPTSAPLPSLPCPAGWIPILLLTLRWKAILFLRH